MNFVPRGMANWGIAERVFSEPSPAKSTIAGSKSVPNEPSSVRFTTPGSSSVPKSACLQDWWLIRATGKGLAVGGVHFQEKIGLRIFCSGPIVKRVDASTLETEDGFTVKITSMINRSRTHQNGFTYEVCDRFMLGFPYYWEDYATQPYNEESIHRGNTRIKNFLQDSVTDLPVSRLRDLLVSVHREEETSGLKKNIYNNIQLPVHINAFRCQTVQSEMEQSSATVPDQVMVDETCTGDKGEVAQKSIDDGVLEAKDKTETPNIPRKGVLTRSMTRLNNSKRKLNDNPSLNSVVKNPSSSGFISSMSWD